MNCRKNVSQMTSAEKTAYVDAVLALKAAPITQADLPQAWTAGARNRYDVYVWIHLQIGLGAHLGPAFAPWHREFLRQFELELQSLSGNPKLTIPYWDWIEYKSTSDNSPDSEGKGAGFPFTADFMGGMGTGTDNRVETGAFAESAGFSINVRTGQNTGPARDNTTYLRRETGQNPTSLPSTSSLNFALNRPAFDASPFREIDFVFPTNAEFTASFRKSLEYSLHNGPHGWVGGNMMPQTSPNDPIFFLHHCNVDKIWAIWQQRNPGGITNYQPISGEPGHDLNSIMAVLNQSFFLFPIINRPTNLLNHKALGFMYDTDLPSISLMTPTVIFGEVPENTTSYLPLQFDIETCRKVKFSITSIGGNSAFQVPDLVVPYEAIVLPNEGEMQTGEVYIKLNATTGLGVINGTATIEAFIEDTQGHYSAVAGDFQVGSWTVNFNAEIIARPKSAICLVLDKSGSMSANDGTSITRFEMLENAVSAIKDIVRSDDGIGMVYYDTNENRLFDITEMASGGTTNVNNALANSALNPGGATAIGKGIIEGADVLNDEINRAGTPYTNYGMLVLTDGNENVSPNVSSAAVNTAISGIEGDIYAVGLGKQGGVSDAVLSNISRYILITGEMQGDERLFRLTNYFVQILADISKNDIILDPVGRLIFGLAHEVEYNISEADIYADIIILSPLAPFINVKLIAPNGNVLQGNVGNVSHKINSTNQVYRVSFPAIPNAPNGTHAGQWKVVLQLSSKEEIQKYWHNSKRFEELLSKIRKYKSVPYSVTIQTYSDLKFKASVEKTTNIIGAEIKLLAALTQYKLPIDGNVRAEINLPNGAVKTISLSQAEKGQFSANFKVEQSGVYQIRLKANGYSLSGKKFSREALRSISIYKDKPVIPTDGENSEEVICKIIDCLMSQKGVIKFLKKNNISPQRIKRCLKSSCMKKRKNPHGKPQINKPTNIELQILNRLEPLIMNSPTVELIDAVPKLASIKFVTPEIPKFNKKPMMMQAFSINEKGEIVQQKTGYIEKKKGNKSKKK